MMTDRRRGERVADEIIKNTYRTLLTRGMKGCYVFCTDKGLQEHLKEMRDAVYSRKHSP